MATVACIGLGNVGRAWAVVFLRAGHEVRVHDADPAQVPAAVPLIRRTLEQLHAAGHLPGGVEAAMARLIPAASIADAVRGAGHVQESVREDLAIKRSVMAEVATHAPDDCIIASSTSALPGSSFLSHIRRPQRALVAHPVNPPSLIPLVELCGSDTTSPDTIDRCRALMLAAGMKPVTLHREIDGFLLNRLQYTLVAEAMHLVGEGYCSAEDIDRVMTDGLALRWLTFGPFATAHLNATGGFAGFVAQLGPMMRHMGNDARTSYDWGQDLVDRIHDEMVARIPVGAIPDWQGWRDSRILAARGTQSEGETTRPDT